MLFNSLVFAFFLPIVFVLYWLLDRASLRIKNGLLVVASYVFYGWWDWRFLGLIIVSSAVDYLVGLGLGRTEDARGRKALLGVSIAVNLGILGFFKYYGFLVDSFVDALQAVGYHPNIRSLHIILPVGISFYTFQTMSYTIDVYRKQIEPTREMLAFFAYVSFFPQLVAGPIERARHLLPQFLERRKFDTRLAGDGLRQILWGLFKKVVIADNLALLVDPIYADHGSYGGLALFLGTLYFAIQIYCDFSGYSDIAIGTARLFGFDLMRNFAYPYFSRDIGEFWRRWHISLSTWFRDYVYIPLGGSRTSSKFRHIANLIITFAVSGLWHGANWTFLVWGLLNGLYYIPLVLAKKHKRFSHVVAADGLFPSRREALQIGLTFLLTLFAWIFFRSDSISLAFDFIGHMATTSWLSVEALKGLVYTVPLVVIEWMQRDKEHALQIDHMSVWMRWLIYYAIVGALFLFGYTGVVPFIYFQF